MTDFKLPTLQPNLANKEGLEQRDENSVKFNEQEQDRIAGERTDPFESNRVIRPSVHDGVLDVTLPWQQSDD